MSDLEASRQRLEQALARLESAVAARSARLAGAAPELPLGPDIQGLTQALEAAQRENTHLARVNEAVSRRLDAAIARLKSVIEE